MDLQNTVVGMSPEAWFAAAAAVISLVALFFTGVAAKAASDQTKIQRQLRVDSAQPYVWVDIREDEASSSLLTFVMGNSGPTVATHIRVQISSQLPTDEPMEEMIRRLEGRLSEGFQSLAPNRTIRWPLGMGHRLLAEVGGRSYTFTVDAHGPFGPVDTLTYTVDMDDWREMKDSPPGSLHMVRQSIDALSKQIAQGNR